MRLPPEPQRRPWERAPHGSRTGFRMQLATLDRDLVAIAEDLAASTHRVLDGLETPATSASPAAHADDADRRRSCRALEDRGFVLIAREAPVAADLREVVAVTRAITDLERCSRLLVHIADAIDRLGPVPPGRLRGSLRDLAAATRRILAGGVEAWRERDGLAVNELRRLDDEVDRLQEELLSELYVDDHAVEEVVAAALLARHLERLADHGVALAGHVSWAVTGDRVGSTA